MRQKKALLFISPIIPQKQGNGLAMRAGTWLKILSPHFRIFLLVVPVSDPKRLMREFPFQNSVEQIHTISISRLKQRLLYPLRFLEQSENSQPEEWHSPSPELIHKVGEAFSQTLFDSIFIFRLYMFPYALPFIQRNQTSPNLRLDLDDIESDTRKNIAQLYREAGEIRQSLRLESEAAFYEKMEKTFLPQVNTLYVCSEKDKQSLKKKHQLQKVVIAPNTIAINAKKDSTSESKIFTYLFVGNLNYFPNEDAVLYFLNQIFPQIQAKAARPVRLQVVGSYSKHVWKSMKKSPSVHFSGQVPEVKKYYDTASAIVVPLRAGGGTRIKILEAFSHQVPVVSTEIGASGLKASHNNELLIANTPEEFASSCLSLLNNRELSKRLVEKAYDCVQKSYSTDRLSQVIGV